MQRESLEKLRQKERRLRMEVNAFIGSPARPLVHPDRAPEVYKELARVRQKIKEEENKR